VILLDLRPLFDPAKLHEGIACIALVGGADHLVLVLGGDESELGELGSA